MHRVVPTFGIPLMLSAAGSMRQHGANSRQDVHGHGNLYRACGVPFARTAFHVLRMQMNRCRACTLRLWRLMGCRWHWHGLHMFICSACHVFRLTVLVVRYYRVRELIARQHNMLSHNFNNS